MTAQEEPVHLYYVEDTRQIVGNCVLWWAKESRGYTCELSEAGLYTREQVLRMRDTDRPWPREIAEAAVVQHVRKDQIHRAVDRELPGYYGPMAPRDWLALLESGNESEGAA